MEEKKVYTKLSALVGDTFMIEVVNDPCWKRWDPATSKMLVVQEPTKDYRKIYTCTTDKGTLDLTAGQLGQILECISEAGRADVIGKKIKLASNGGMGMDIRYYFNPVKNTEHIEEDW